MKIIDFSNKEFQDIQNNPAYGNNECLMLVKDHKTNRIVILHILPHPVDSVTHVAIVWRREIADIICNNFKGEKS